MQNIDYDYLTKELDKVKATIFMGDNSAFLGSLLCSLEFKWNSDIKTAQTDGTSIEWNPEWFLALPKTTRGTVLKHELWHVGKGHMFRGQTYDPEIWNQACDHHINLDLQQSNNSFEGTTPLKDKQFIGMAEEEIYAVLIKQEKTPKGGWGVVDETGDLLKPTKQQIIQGINILALAVKQAELSGQGNQGRTASEVIKAYLEPKVNWEDEIFEFFKELESYRYTYRRPNRRHPDMYMPSRYKAEGKLQHLMYFLDCSASISRKELERFNSEVKYIKDVFNPKLLTLVMFDTRITKVIKIEDNEEFDSVTVHGRGGTDYRPVRKMIIDEEPTAAIIFTDLECEPMKPLPIEIPIIWIAVNARKHPIHVGKVIHIKE